MSLQPTPFQPAGPAALPHGFGFAFRMNGAFGKRPGELRNLGSICCELAMVACGGFQYAAFAGPRLWDVAAGVLLVREAGGVALTWDAGSWRPLERFVPPARSRRRKSPTLRDWVRPVLVASPGAYEALASSFVSRPAPPLILRLAFRGQRAAWHWWRARRKPSPGEESRPPASPA